MAEGLASADGPRECVRLMAEDRGIPFRALFEGAPSLCLVLTPDEFEIVAVSFDPSQMPTTVFNVPA